MIYLLILVLLLVLSIRYDINGKEKGCIFWYYFFLVLFVLIAGLRYRLGIDTPNYIETFYHSIPKIQNVTLDDLLNVNPLWFLLNSIVFSFLGKFYFVQLTQALIVNVLIFKYIKKHVSSFYFSLLLYFVLLYFSFNMEELKAGIALSICLFGNDYIIEHKYVKGILLYTLAGLFHFSAFLLLITPLFVFLRFNRIGVLVLFISFFCGFLMQELLGDYIEIFEFNDQIANKADGYISSDKYGGGKGVGYVLINIMPYLCMSVMSLFYINLNKNCNKELKELEPFLLLGLCFLLMQIGFQLFYRYVHFYNIYMVIFISYCVIDVIKNSKNLSFSLSLFRCLVVLLPFLFLLIYGGYRTKYIRYYPYSSVIERKIDRQRELVYSESPIHSSFKNYNEY